MYNLKVTNNYIWPLTASDGSQVKQNGGTASYDNQGNMYLTIPGMTEICFLDLGDHKLPGYPIPTQTWGALVRYGGVEAYYRYEGQGQLELTIDNLGTCTLKTTNGSMIPISLEEFIVETN